MGLFTLSKSVYCFTLMALSLMILLFIVLAVRPYKEQFKAYNIIEAFMIFFLGVLNIAVVARDEADTNDQFYNTGSNVILGLVGLVPLIYLVVLSIWCIFVKRELKRKLPFFRGVDSNTAPSRSQEIDDLPDRMENPRMYQAQAAPLLCDQEHDHHQDAKYGATLTFTGN